MNYKTFFSSLILVLIFSIGGCAMQGLDPTESDGLTIHTYDSEEVNISNVYVRQFEKEILIHADARPLRPVRIFHPGHLSFEIFTEDK